MHVLTLVFIIYFGGSIAVSNASKYSGRYDTLDIDEILQSDRLLKNYFECLMERGPCTPEGTELRKIIPNALKTECRDCTESQKQKAAKAIRHLQENKPDMYEELEGKYDPEGTYRARLESNLHMRNSMSDGLKNSLKQKLHGIINTGK